MGLWGPGSSVWQVFLAFDKGGEWRFHLGRGEAQLQRDLVEPAVTSEGHVDRVTHFSGGVEMDLSSSSTWAAVGAGAHRASRLNNPKGGVLSKSIETGTILIQAFTQSYLGASLDWRGGAVHWSIKIHWLEQRKKRRDERGLGMSFENGDLSTLGPMGVCGAVWRQQMLLIIRWASLGTFYLKKLLSIAIFLFGPQDHP